MKKEKFSHVRTEFNMSQSEAIEMSDTFRDRVIKTRLSNEISDYLVENIDRLPIEFMKKHEPMEGIFTYRADMMIIDKGELDRLKEVEWQYNQLCR